MSQADCIFCKIIQESTSDDIIWQDEKVLIMLDTDWVVKGHTLVVWKNHVYNVSDLTEEEYLHFSKAYHKVEKVLLQVLQKERGVVLKLGGMVAHFHFHIYPVDKDINLAQAYPLFSKKVQYMPKVGEKEEFIKRLQSELQSSC